MHPGLIGGVVATIVVGLGIGWLVGSPKDDVRMPNRNLPSFHEVKAGEIPTPAIAGADSSPGWQDRKSIRDRLNTAITAFDQDPCDDKARQGFLDAWVARGHALIDSGATPDGGIQPYWRTSDDIDIDQAIDQLKKKNYTTEDEMGRAMFMSSPLGRREIADYPDHSERPLVLFQRCGRAPTYPETAMRLQIQQKNDRLARHYPAR